MSTFVTGAVRARFEACRRRAAARQVLATFDPEDIPTADEKRALLMLWASPRTVRTRTKRWRQRR